MLWLAVTELVVVDLALRGPASVLHTYLELPLVLPIGDSSEIALLEGLDATFVGSF